MVVVDNPSVVRSTNVGNCGVPDVVSGQVATAHSGDASETCIFLTLLKYAYF